MKILITGGAGFIGSHVVDTLIEKGYSNVTIFDNLEEQVHGPSHNPPEYLNPKAEFLKGSLLDYNLLKRLIKDTDILIHLGAVVGVAQSMYQIRKYTETNIIGTGNILDILTNCDHNVQKLIIASSNTVYGEGKYQCSKCGVIFPPLRSKEQLSKKVWEILCPNCGSGLKPLPCDESSHLTASSIYALSKKAQEQMSFLIGKTYGINTVILRFFLVYGARQTLSNPYTGVCGIFASRLLNNNPPLIYEDGLQTRDFVHVKDVCQAITLAIEKSTANNEVFNVGTGIPISIKEIAEIITQKLNPNIQPMVTEKYRVGDIRHCLADITKIKNKLGYKPTVNFTEGINDVLDWIRTEIKPIQDKSDIALNELKEKGLLR